MSPPALHIALINGDPGIPLQGPSGASIHLRAMAQAHAQLGHRVTAFTTRLHPPRGRPISPLPAGVVAHEIPPKNLFYPLRAWPELREVRHNGPFYKAARGHLSAHPPDLIYERFSLFSDAGRRLARHFCVPHIIEVNAPLALEKSRYHGLQLSGLGRRFERRILSAADRCVVVSSALKQHLLGLGIPPERVQVEANGVDTGLFMAPERRRDPQGDGPMPRLIFAGGFRPWHGLGLLLPLMDALHREGDGAQLTLIGDGPARAQLEGDMQGRPWAHAVQFLGHLPQAQVARHLAEADLAVVPPPPPGLEYFCPLKVIEAMASGLPVVASHRGDVPTLLGIGGDAPAGITLNGTDAAMWAQAIRQLWGDEARRRHMAAAGRARALQHDWRLIAGRILEGIGAVR